jgi:serpin B
MIANGCWGREGLVYIDSYLDTLSQNYDADIDFLDFVGQPEASRQAINQWVQEQTAGLIDELLPEGAIDPLTYLILANTVYFRAEWLKKFDTLCTWPGIFTRLDGSQVEVPFMGGVNEGARVYEGNDCLALDMLYEGQELSMLFILPDEGQYQAFEDRFNAAVLDTIIGNLVTTDVELKIPKFGFFSDFDLKATLQALGITDAFEGGVADFSGMDGSDDGIPWLEFVVHQTYIEIDEYGTLAAAGTGMGFTIGFHGYFTAVRPFIFVIRDIPTGTILFMGRVLDPSVH